MGKILLISNHGVGFHNFKRELVEKLLDYKHEVHFAVPYDEKIKGLIKLGAVYHDIRIDRRGVNPFKDLKLVNQLQKIITEIKPDVLVLHTIKPNIYGGSLAKHYKIPYINNITGIGSSLQVDNLFAKLIRFMYRYSLSKSCGIFFENIGNQEFFRKYHIGNTKNYYLVSGAGVNLEYYKPNNCKIANAFIRFLFIGRIMREKGVDEFFAAAEYLTKKYKQVKFQVVGFYDESEYVERMNILIKKEIIEYLGFSEDIKVEMSQADCIVLPSYHEGMSNVLLEGAAMGLPIITTNIPGCREAVEDGRTGFLCDVSDIESLINAMEKFITLSPEERIEMGQSGRDKMEREFDRKLVVDRYIQCIKKALKE